MSSQTPIVSDHPAKNYITKFDEEFNELTDKFEKNYEKLHLWTLDDAIKTLQNKVNEFRIISKYDIEEKPMFEKYVAIYKNCTQKWIDNTLKESEQELLTEEIRLENIINKNNLIILMNQDLRSCLYEAEFPITKFRAEWKDGTLFLDCTTAMGVYKGWIDGTNYHINEGCVCSHEFEDDVYDNFIELAVKLSKFEKGN